MFNRLTLVLVVFVSLLTEIDASAQHDFERTRTVDPKMNAADYETIQEAIDSITDTTVKWTVLVYAGTYTIDETDELITLDGTQENIDIIGVDPEAVIIDVTIGDATNNYSGIKITSGSETSRNNAIRNLTIKTKFGHGIEIVKGGGGGDQTPKNIAIDGVTIKASGTGMNGIDGADADTVRIFNSDIDSADGNGIDAGDNFSVIGSRITALADTRRGINIESRRGLTVSNCDNIAAGLKGIHIGRLQGGDNCHDIEVENSVIRAINASGTTEGVSLYAPGDNVRFRNCLISAETDSDAKGVYGDFPELDTTITPVFDNCVIDAIGGTNATAVKGIQIDNTDNLQILNCTIRASCANTSSTVRVYGVYCPTEAISVVGGSIMTSAAGDKASDVYDLVGDAIITPTAGHIFVSGVSFSKWLGAINASGRAQNITQIVNDVSISDDDAILEETALTSIVVDDDNPDGQPDVYRVLSVTGNVFGMNQDVYIVGTNWGGDRIAEKIKLNGAATVNGKRPFASVTSVILPAETNSGQTVKVGTSNILGLYYPIESSSDVLQQARATDTTTAYTFESVGTIGPDGVDYSTVDINGTLQDGDSVQWLLLAPR